MKFTREALLEAFEKVQSPSGWKYPIDTIIESKDLEITVESISYFAGSPTFVEETLKNGKIKITAPGYYVCVGA